MGYLAIIYRFSFPSTIFTCFFSQCMSEVKLLTILSFSIEHCLHHPRGIFSVGYQTTKERQNTSAEHQDLEKRALMKEGLMTQCLILFR